LGGVSFRQPVQLAENQLMVLPVLLTPEIDFLIAVILICFEFRNRRTMIIDLLCMIFTELLARPVFPVPPSRYDYLVDPNSNVAYRQRRYPNPCHRLGHAISPSLSEFPNLGLKFAHPLDERGINDDVAVSREPERVLVDFLTRIQHVITREK
jgi:hypothetical protein